MARLGERVPLLFRSFLCETGRGCCCSFSSGEQLAGLWVRAHFRMM